MKIHILPALLLALPLVGAGAASAQSTQSSVTSFDRYGNPIIQYTSPSDADYVANGLRSSITSFGPGGVPNIQYTSPPLNPTGITQPLSVAQVIANQNLYGQSLPGYGYNNGYYQGGYGGYGYGYGYGYTPPPYTVFPLGQSKAGFAPPVAVTVIPLPSANTYPAPGYPYGGYGYGNPGYGYGNPGYAYPQGYGYQGSYPYGGVNSSYNSQSTGYGVRFGNGGAQFSFGGNNVSSNSTTTIRRR